MPTPAAYAPPAPRGIAFEIAEHVAVRSWAEAHNLRVTTEIDRVISGEEYEEVLAVYLPNSSWRRLTLWRSADAVVMESSRGPVRRFAGIWDAIEAATGQVGQAPSPVEALRALRRARLQRDSSRRND